MENNLEMAEQWNAKNMYTKMHDGLMYKILFKSERIILEFYVCFVFAILGPILRLY